MNIGVIGTGDIGAVIIRKLRHAGYAVCPSLGSNLELDSWSPRSLCHLSRRGGLYSTPDPYFTLSFSSIRHEFNSTTSCSRSPRRRAAWPRRSPDAISPRPQSAPAMTFSWPTISANVMMRSATSSGCSTRSVA
jgi:hypothetical protein